MKSNIPVNSLIIIKKPYNIKFDNLMKVFTDLIKRINYFSFFQERNPSNANTKAATEDLPIRPTERNTPTCTPQINLTTVVSQVATSRTLTHRL